MQTNTSTPASSDLPAFGMLGEALCRTENLVLVALDTEGRILAFNRGAERLTGYTEAELIGRDWFEVLVPRDRYPEVWETFHHLRSGGLAPRFQNPVLTKAGEERIVSWCNDALTRGGVPIGTLSYGQDVTEQVRAQRATEKSEEILDRIFNTAHFCIVYLDRDFDFIRVNKAYAEVCGHPPEFFPGRNHFVLYPHEENEAIFRRVVETGEPFTIFAKPFVFPDQPGRGTTYWDWTLHPVKGADGTVEGLLFALLEVTERKRMEAQLLHMQRVDILGHLAGGIAHDFNNLLTAIIGEAGLGAFDTRDPEAQEHFRTIEEVSGRAARLTRQLLAFARRQPTEHRPLDLNELTERLLRTLHRLLGERIELAFLPGPQLWWVKADAGQMEQILVNLAVNARDAMPEGGTLTVETADRHFPEPPAPGLPAGDYVLWTVRDTGTGMSPEVAAQAFEPFFTTKPGGRGTGLGLATCQGIVHQHGGAILLDTAPGRGTRFTVLLPRTRQHPETAIHLEEPMPHGTETLLVVEDQPEVRRVAVRTLESLGYEVLEAVHGEEAVLLAQDWKGSVHLAIIDLVLPMVGGAEAARRLRTVHPDLKVVFVSGYAEALPAPVLDRAPWARFLEKPYTPSQLAQKVRELLDAPA